MKKLFGANKKTDYFLEKSKNIKRLVTSVSPIKSNNEPWCRDNKQKIDLFAKYLADIFIPNQSQL